MQIEIETIIENEDGSAKCIVRMDSAAKDFLIRYAFIACLNDAIEAGKLATPTEGEE